MESSFAKSHLLTFLQAISSGVIYWSDTGDLMVPPPGQRALHDHIAYGMYYEVFSYDVCVKDLCSLVALIASDNMDANSCLGQTTCISCWRLGKHARCKAASWSIVVGCRQSRSPDDFRPELGRRGPRCSVQLQ